MILRRIARPMLAAVFVSGGVETLRNPKPRVETAAPIVEKAGEKVGDQSPVPMDPELLVKVNAVAQVAAGTALGLGKFPRLSALVLAASLAPTTVVGHRFWEKDGADRGAQRTHFLKNVGLLGGLLIAASDTHGKPSLAWRAKHAGSTAAASVGGTVGGTVGTAAGAVQGVAQGAAASVQGAAEGAAKSVKGSVKSVQGTAKKAAKSVEGTTKALKKKSAAVLS
jgi:putative oxidoreductase